MHMAKHSFSDYAVKSKVDLLVLSKLLGHVKLSTTQHYLKDFYQKEESEQVHSTFPVEIMYLSRQVASGLSQPPEQSTIIIGPPISCCSPFFFTSITDSNLLLKS